MIKQIFLTTTLLISLSAFTVCAKATQVHSLTKKPTRLYVFDREPKSTTSKEIDCSLTSLHSKLGSTVNPLFMKMVVNDQACGTVRAYNIEMGKAPANLSGSAIFIAWNKEHGAAVCRAGGEHMTVGTKKNIGHLALGVECKEASLGDINSYLTKKGITTVADVPSLTEPAYEEEPTARLARTREEIHAASLEKNAHLYKMIADHKRAKAAG